MCNLYSMTTNQQAIRELARAMRDTTGNLPLLPGIFPDQPAPVVRTGADGVRELVLARWGMPSPAFALAGRKVDRGVTNVRNTDSPHWRHWLTPASRCLVPFTSFSESFRRPDGKSEPLWFALNATRPLAFFAGIWTGWTCTRKVAEGEVAGDLFAFLTTEPNREVAAVHPKAMPVILTTITETEAWLGAPWPDARRLQRPLADGGLRTLAREEGENPPAVRVPSLSECYPRTPDGRYFVVRGRLWRLANPALTQDVHDALLQELMAARRAVRDAKREPQGVAPARARVDAAKRCLGERGPVWWDDGAPDYNRRMKPNSAYSAWHAELRAGG